MRTPSSSVQKRIFVAFADYAILIALKNHHHLTGYGVNKYFLKKVGDAASPSTIYTNLATLERKQLVKCVKDQNGRAYALTEKGQKTVADMPNSVLEIKRFMDLLLRCSCLPAEQSRLGPQIMVNGEE